MIKNGLRRRQKIQINFEMIKWFSQMNQEFDLKLLYPFVKRDNCSAIACGAISSNNLSESVT